MDQCTVRPTDGLDKPHRDARMHLKIGQYLLNLHLNFIINLTAILWVLEGLRQGFKTMTISTTLCLYIYTNITMKIG